MASALVGPVRLVNGSRQVRRSPRYWVLVACMAMGWAAAWFAVGFLVGGGR